ncbi:MAG: hypothetical protein H6926_03525 [Chromatiales bacterium]|nr:hypothetical protein [Chromatiales bacterium]
MNAVTILDQDRIVSASDDHNLMISALGDDGLWRTVRTLNGHSSSVTAIAVFDHDRIVSASDDHTLRIWAPGKNSQWYSLHTSKGIPVRSPLSPSSIATASSAPQ